MKEKRIDAYLSMASLCHLVIVGAGATLGNEIFQEAKRPEVLFVTTFVLIGVVILSIAIYDRIFTILSNKNPTP